MFGRLRRTVELDQCRPELRVLLTRLRRIVRATRSTAAGAQSSREILDAKGWVVCFLLLAADAVSSKSTAFCLEGRVWEVVAHTASQVPGDGPAGKLLDLMDRHHYRPAHIHFIVSPSFRVVATPPKLTKCFTTLGPSSRLQVHHNADLRCKVGLPGG